MDDNLVFDDNSVYEIDLDCERKKRQFDRKNRKIKMKKAVQKTLKAKEYHSFSNQSMILFVILIYLCSQEAKKYESCQ